MRSAEVIRLRPARAEDHPAIRRLIWRVHINFFDLDWRRFVIAEGRNGELIGCGQLKPHSDGSTELASIAVREHYRGAGAARLIINQLIEAAPRPLYLICLPRLTPFYERFGFRVAVPGEMTPSFLRLYRFTRPFASILPRQAPVTMRLD